MLSNKQKKSIIAGALVSGLILSGSFVAFGVPYFDQVRVAAIEKRANNLIENSYTNSIKDNVTASEVESILKDVESIRDTKKKKSLKTKVDSLLDQAKLQTGLKDKLKSYSEKTNFSDLNIDDLRSLIDQASGINNIEVRNKVFKDANEILDKMNYSTYVESEASKMSSSNPGQYYIVNALVENLYYEDVKQSVNEKLKKMQTEIEKKTKDETQEKKEKEQKSLDQAKQGTTYSFTKGNSDLKQVSETQLLVIEKIISDSSLAGKKFIGIGGGKVVVYSTELSSNGEPNVKELVNVEYKRNRSGNQSSVFSNFSLETSRIKSNGFSIGLGNQDDVQVSENGLNSLREVLR